MNTSPSPADRVEALSFATLSLAIAHATWSGYYERLTTPRLLPYLIASVPILLTCAALAWKGHFHATPKSCSSMLCCLFIPALLISIPFTPQMSDQGFDPYGGGIAIPITRTSIASHALVPPGLHGLDQARHTITISDEEFGSWYEHIDHYPNLYKGYHVRVKGFVDVSPRTPAGSFVLSRQLMSCCILDMTPFGFVVRPSANAHVTATPDNHAWVTVEAIITVDPTHSPNTDSTRNGIVLDATGLQPARAPEGYFYRQ